MNLPIAPLAAALLGTAAAAACALMPGAMLEGLVTASGLPAVLAAAEPPLGTTARFAIAGGAGGLVAVFGWLILFLLLGTRGITAGRSKPVEADAVFTPVLRRADAHPDAPPRPPLLATRDLGTPFLEVTARSPVDAESGERDSRPLFVAEPEPEPVAAEVPEEQDLPLDLEQPLAAFDPQAIREAPMPPPVTLPPLRPVARPAVFDTSERFETFELTPIRRTPPPPRLTPAPRQREEAITRPETEATIHALLDRLEKGVVKRGIASGSEAPRTPREAERGLEEALVTLRNLARRA
ncbi:MAG: hypothetical protein V4574_19430 [Pseudomonadota bacterium]